MKKQFKIVCECKMNIIGFSETHAKKNLEIHKLLSKEHKERKKIIEQNPNIIFVYNLKTDDLVEFLASHPIVIEEIKDIGR